MKNFLYPARSPRLRRLFFFGLVGLTTVFAVGLLTSVYQKDGLSPLELALLALYAILSAWIALSFWSATLGFWIQWRQKDDYAIYACARHAQTEAGGESQAPLAPLHTALLMPVYNEDPKRVFAGLHAMCDSLLNTGEQQHFDIYILSDTRDPEIWLEEELRWRHLSRTMQGKIAVYYRNRVQNTERKVGNIKDFCIHFGGHYRYMLVLDADSLMSGETLVDMVRVMERNPKVALLQVPPMPVNKESLFARILQFAGNVYSPIFTAGLNYWQLGEGNYWGHNAILRVQAFTKECGLPRLPGREPFGGDIFSHDFVEAAMLRKAGWQVWLAYDLGGSYEELPPTLIDFAKRDRRWCQGNLQHSSLVMAQGWHPINRLHFLMGIMSYLASPLWLLFLILTGVDAYFRSQSLPVYFTGATLFPVWPASYTVEMATVLVVTLFMLFLPKLLALALLLKQHTLPLYGGALKAGLSVLLETLISVLLAPILMLFQTSFVVAILLRRNISWSTQQREDHQTGLFEAIAAHGTHTLLGFIVGWFSYHYINNFFWWLTPVLAGLVLSIPLSMLLSNLFLGIRTHRIGLFLTPEETSPPYVLQRLHYYLAQPDPPLLSNQSSSRFMQVLLEPPAHNLHTAPLPPAHHGKRHRHYLQGLIYQLLEEGAERLNTAEKRALLSDKEALQTLHILFWSQTQPPFAQQEQQI